MKRLAIASAAVLAMLLSGCGVTVVSPGVTNPSTPAPPAVPASEAVPASAPATAPPGASSLPGYAFGEFPPVPSFVMPDLSMLDSSMAGFAIKVRESFPTVPGVTIRPARCDKAGTVQTDTGSLQLYGDGSGNYTGPDGTTINYGDGSGNYSINGKKVTVYGDGSGNYTAGNTTIISYGDGSGNYNDGIAKIVLYGDGSGNYEDQDIKIINYGDGSGNYTNGEITIINYGNGAGNYEDQSIKIINYGDGTGSYENVSTGESIAISVAPIAAMEKLGTFPRMGTLKPIKSCGTRIIIEDSVMFDFNKDSLRPEAKTTIASLAKLFTDLKVGKATISGHTDSIGTDEYNQGLSERRANSVLSALQAANVTTTLEAHGYGETKPIAPNNIKGKDNPAGRQQNRRVEIFIPSGS